VTTVLSTPPQPGIAFRINQAGDGSLVPCDTPNNGPAGFGVLTLVVGNFGTGLSDLGGVVGMAAFVQANAGFPLPFARYYVDFQKLKVAAAAGLAYTASTY